MGEHAWGANEGDKQTGASEKTSDGQTLAPIVVTSTKQNTTAFDAAVSASVVDGLKFEQGGHQYLDDLAQQLPNMYFSDFSGGPGTIIIRGMGSNDEEADVSSIGVQLDGISLPLTSLVGRILDLEQIEVLRGPQNLLHGQGAIGGLVALRSRDPGFVFGGSVYAQYGTSRQREAGMALDIPLSSSTAIRISADRELNDASNEKPTLNRSNTAGWNSNVARLKLLHNDQSGGQWRFGLHHMERNGGNDYFTTPALVNQHESTQTDSGINDMKYTLASGEYTRALDAVTRFTAIVGAQSSEWSYWLPASVFGATNGFDMKMKSYSAEARVARTATANSPFDWMAGAYVSYTDMDRPYLYDYAGVFTSATSSQVNATTLAAFGELGWHFTPQWRVAVGLRVAQDRRDIDWSSDQNGSVEQVSRKIKDNVVLPQVMLEYRPDAQQFSWIKLARGYTPSGFNIYSTAAQDAGNTFSPEHTNYGEIGYRLKGVEDNWQLGAVAFYSRMRDQQVKVTTSGGSAITENAARSHSYGVELNATVRPFSTLEMQAYAGYIKAIYDDYVRSSSEDYSGRQFMGTPRSNAGLSVLWTPVQNWQTSVSVRHIGKVNIPTAYYAEDGYTLVDANVTWHLKNWSVNIYGKNLTDKDYLTRAISSGNLVVAGTPRTFGVRVTYAF